MISSAARRLARRLNGPTPAARRLARTAGAAGPADVELLESRALLTNIVVNLANPPGGDPSSYTVPDGTQCVIFQGNVRADETDFEIDASNVTGELELVWNGGFAAPTGPRDTFGNPVDGEEVSLTVTGNEDGAGLTFEARRDVVVTEFEFTGTNGDDALIGNIYCTRAVFDADGVQESDGGDMTVELLEGDNTTLQADLRTGEEFDGEDGHTMEITAGEGDDTLGAIVTDGNVIIDLGAGANETLIVSTSGVGVNDDGEEFARDITVTTGGDGSSSTFGDLNASGRIIYNGGDGDDTVGVIESGVGGRGGNNTSGNGSQGGTEGVIVVLGEGTNVTDDISADDGFAVVVGGSGSDTIGDVEADGEFDYFTLTPVAGIAGQTNFTGEAVVNLGDGDNETGTLTSRRGTVRYTGGDGDDTVGNVRTTTAGVSGDFQVPDEPGDIQQADFGDAVLQLGDGNNVVRNVTANFGDVSIVGGNGSDTLGNVTGGGALTEVTFRDSIRVGSGAVAKPTANVTEGPGRQFLGDVFVTLGDGLNTTASIFAREGTAYYVGGADADTIGDVTASLDNQFDIDPNNNPNGVDLRELFLQLGAGDDTVGDVTATGGDVTVLGGAGDEEVGDVFAGGSQGFEAGTGNRQDAIILDYRGGGATDDSRTGFVTAEIGSIRILGDDGDDLLAGTDAQDDDDQIVPGSSDNARVLVDFADGNNGIFGTLEGGDRVDYRGGRDVDSLGDVISNQDEVNVLLGASDDFIGDVTGNTIFVSLGQGNDEAGDFFADAVDPTAARGTETLILDAGDGDDTFGDLVSVLDVTLRAGGGDDVVTLVDSRNGNANLDLGDGEDSITGTVDARFDIDVDAGDGDDNISGTLTAGDTAQINLGEGDDVFTGFVRGGQIDAGGNVEINGDDGDDRIDGTLEATGSVDVDAGDGDDFVGGTLDADANVVVALGDGDDRTDIDSVLATTGAFRLDAGDGDDVVQLRNTAVDAGEFIELGEGENAIVLGEGIIAGTSVIRAIGGSLDVRELDDPGFAGRTYLDDRFVRASDRLTVVTDKAEMEGRYVVVGRGDADVRVDAVIDGDVIVIVSGDADVDFSGSEIGGDASVRTSTGDDQVDFFGTTIDGNLRIVTIAGTDEANVRGTTIGGDLVVALGINDDRLVIADATVAGTTNVGMDRGNDYLAVVRSTLAGDVSFQLGDGRDTLSVDGGMNFGGDLTVNAGEGGDGVRLRNYSVADDLFVNMGRGNDFLNGDRLEAGGNVRATGGGGRDRLSIPVTVGADLSGFERVDR